jgi:hypothetical protein
MNIVEAVEDRRLLGHLFKDLKTWKNWLVYLKARDGLKMSADELRIAKERTGRTVFLSKPFREAYAVVARRAGKSYLHSADAVFKACFRDWSPYLSHGEKGYIFLTATDKYQARILKDYISGFLNSSPLLKRMVLKETTFEIELKNRVVISIHTPSFRSIRGFTVLAVYLDELAFFRSEESANPDKELVNAIRPALATVPDAQLVGFSNPYWKAGVLYEMTQKHFGNNDSDVLIWRADAMTMNPTLDKRIIERAFESDPVSARSEWGGEFRPDLENFVGVEIVQARVVPNRFELPLIARTKYVGSVDPSGGRNDSMTLAVAHSEGEKIVLDCIREKRPPFSPEAVVKEFSEVFMDYGIKFIKSDRYSGEWVVEAFRKKGITVEPSELSASELYGELLPILMSGRVELLDSKRLVNQLSSLERRVRVGGKDLISHPVGLHDDLANAVAGAIVSARMKSKGRAFFRQYPEIDFFEERVPNPLTMRNFDPSSLSEEEADELFDHGFRFRR